MDIKAIETVYKGYRFRSRLEARWAVFFDTLGLKWEYEPEGFVLPSGANYLPDFRVTSPTGNVQWYEIKPLGTHEEPKFDEFREAVTPYFGGGPVITATMLSGDPWDWFTGTDEQVGEGCACPRCGQLKSGAYTFKRGIGMLEGGTCRIYCFQCDMGPPSGGWDEYDDWEVGELFRVPCGFHKGDILVLDEGWQEVDKDLQLAAQKARSARFEHNERESMARA